MSRLKSLSKANTTVIEIKGSVESIVAGTVFGYGRPAAATMAYKYGVYLLPKQLDEKVAELHFPALGAALTVFTQEHP